MAFTRYHDDPLRIMKQLQESTDQGLYGMNVPGNGTNLPFLNDPQVRLQKWGANRHNRFVQIESELWGMQHTLTRDCTESIDVKAYPKQYPTEKKEVTAQSRTLTPAWEVRSVAVPRWEKPFEDPQAHILIPFPYNGNSRQKARDQWNQQS